MIKWDFRKQTVHRIKWKVEKLNIDMETDKLQNGLDRFSANKVHYKCRCCIFKNNKMVNMENILVQINKIDSFEN